MSQHDKVPTVTGMSPNATSTVTVTGGTAGQSYDVAEGRDQLSFRSARGVADASLFRADLVVLEKIIKYQVFEKKKQCGT